MLNVAFTRPRDEVHVFPTHLIDAFAFADGRPGALGDWLRHRAAIEAAPRSATAGSRLGNVDSEFEADVAGGLRGRVYVSCISTPPAASRSTYWWNARKTVPGSRSSATASGSTSTSTAC
jgi:hypothetical protein